MPGPLVVVPEVKEAGRPQAEQGLQRETASPLGSEQSQGKTANNPFKQCSLAGDSGCYVWG